MRKYIALLTLALSAAFLGMAQQAPFYDDIQAFKAADKQLAPPKQAILFIGSSSFTKWKDVSDYFPGYTIINRGFGGSSLPDLIRYENDIIFPYQPRQIVIYCGENDFAASDTVSTATVVKRFQTLYGDIRKHYPKLSLVFISIKPSPSRRHLQPKMIAANQQISKLLAKDKNAAFVNVYPLMLEKDGSMMSKIFLADSLHMNADGYAIWEQALQPYLSPEPGAGQAGDAKMNSFITTLMQKMTLEEKIGQLNLVVGGEATTGSVVSADVTSKIRKGQVGGIFSVTTPARIRKAQELAVKESRLKIPLIFGLDIIHGYKTIFPIPLGLSATWDMHLIEKSARIAAREASADGLNWTFSPMVDIARDPRWGRIAEGSGKDPYLGSAIARAMVKGYQGSDLSATNTILACVKHFALYGAAEAGRDYNTVDMSHLRMYNEYFPPYKAAVDAGVATVMTSFNEIDGVPATANKWLISDVLRKQWGFGGMVVSDYTSVNEMMAHGLGDLKTVSALALKAGLDMDMVGEGFLTTLQQSLKEGKVSMAEIDRACRKVLEAKYRLGLFEDPYRYCDESRARAEIFTEANREQERITAAHSFVLLKNQGNLLPLAKKGTIALVGPLADSRENLVGTWAVSADYAHPPVSLRTALQEATAGAATIVYAKGANISSDKNFEARVSIFGKKFERDDRPEQVLIDEALQAAAKADIVVAALGETAEMTGEASSRSDITLPSSQVNLLKALVATGKPVAVVLFTGRPLAIPEVDKMAPAILNVWFPGSEGAPAIADVLFGAVNPSGKLTATWPQNVGQIPIYYNHKNTGRPLDGEWFQKFRSNYLDVSNEPLYPFGYGLSYTDFTYGDLQLSSQSLTGNQYLAASITVTNTGKLAGEEVVQLYIRDVVGSITRPVKELKGFRKISLQPGQSQVVKFMISTDDLKFYDNNGHPDWEPGAFQIFIGPNARDLKMKEITWVK